MAFIDKLRDELDRAGKAAQGALDEGKTRLEAFRTRQLADKAAQALGYAVFRAKQGGGEIEADTYSRLAATLATHDADAARHEEELEQKRRENRSASTADSAEATAAAGAASSAAASAAAAANAAADSASSAASTAASAADDNISG